MTVPTMPGEGGDQGNVNKAKMLLGQKHAVQLRKLFGMWEKKTLTLDELSYRLSIWFLQEDKRALFLTLIDRAQQRGIDLLYGPASPQFKLWVRIALFNDEQNRVRELHESLSYFSFLVGDEFSD